MDLLGQQFYVANVVRLRSIKVNSCTSFTPRFTKQALKRRETSQYFLSYTFYRAFSLMHKNFSERWTPMERLLLLQAVADACLLLFFCLATAAAGWLLLCCLVLLCCCVQELISRSLLIMSWFKSVNLLVMQRKDVRIRVSLKKKTKYIIHIQT